MNAHIREHQIAPGPYHRIVGDDEDNKYFLRLVTVIINLALLPFAIALGLDVLVTSARIFGDIAEAGAGIAVAAVAIVFCAPLRRAPAVRHGTAIPSR